MDITTTTPKSEPPPPGIHPIKPMFFSNGGILKRHAPLGGAYKECLKNHAATKGGHALDGCGEFLPAPSASAADPTSLTCAACGCHRNFHRRDPEDSSPPVIEYRPHHRHHPPPPPSMTARGSQSPPPISSSYYPHMLLALSEPNRVDSNPNRKRFRTKFTHNQKDKMQELAEKLGWKMQKINDDLVKKVCSEIGVERGVFKVWMHNNKNTLAKRTVSFTGVERNGHGNGDGNSHSHSSSIEQQDHHHHHHHLHNAAANASSSSS